MKKLLYLTFICLFLLGCKKYPEVPENTIYEGSIIYWDGYDTLHFKSDFSITNAKSNSKQNHGNYLITQIVTEDSLKFIDYLTLNYNLKTKEFSGFSSYYLKKKVYKTDTTFYMVNYDENYLVKGRVIGDVFVLGIFNTKSYWIPKGNNSYDIEFSSLHWSQNQIGSIYLKPKK